MEDPKEIDLVHKGYMQLFGVLIKVVNKQSAMLKTLASNDIKIIQKMQQMHAPMKIDKPKEVVKN